MPDDELTRLADAVLRARQTRKAGLPPEIFGGEQAWDLMLVLFIADAHGERLTGQAALRRVGGSMRAGAKWIQFLTAQALIVGDGEGDLGDVLALTPKALHAMEAWLEATIDRLSPGS